MVEHRPGDHANRLPQDLSVVPGACCTLTVDQRSSDTETHWSHVGDEAVVAVMVHLAAADPMARDPSTVDRCTCDDAVRAPARESMSAKVSPASDDSKGCMDRTLHRPVSKDHRRHCSKRKTPQDFHQFGEHCVRIAFRALWPLPPPAFPSPDALGTLRRTFAPY